MSLYRVAAALTLVFAVLATTACEDSERRKALQHYASQFSVQGLTRNAGVAYLRGKVIAIDRRARTRDKLHLYLYRDDLSRMYAEVPGEIGTVLLVERGYLEVGHFTDGSTAYSRTTTLTLVDVAERKIVAERVFVGEAPRARTQSSTGVGVEPDRDLIREYLSGLPTWTARIAQTLELLEAAKRGDAAAITSASARGADVDARCPRPPELQFGPEVLRGSSIEVLRRGSILVDAPSGSGLVPDAPKNDLLPRHPDARKYDWTALLWAAYRGHTAAVLALLKAGADAKADDALGTTALTLATKRGDDAAVQAILAAVAQSDARAPAK